MCPASRINAHFVGHVMSQIDVATSLLSEILTIDQLARSEIGHVLPKGMALSHYMVLNHLAHAGCERSPAQLARSFQLTRGALTNTLAKLEERGWVHIRPDWDDGRRKWVAISDAGIAARDDAASRAKPVIEKMTAGLDEDVIRAMLPALRHMRTRLTRRE